MHHITGGGNKVAKNKMFELALTDAKAGKADIMVKVTMIKVLKIIELHRLSAQQR